MKYIHSHQLGEKMKKRNIKRINIAYLVTFLIVAAIFAASFIKTNVFNSLDHKFSFAGPELFNPEDSNGDVTVKAAARSSTWGKIFDFYNEGITDNNYQAFTYDFTFSNNTNDEVNYFIFKLTFSKEIFLASGWNGSVEIHQKLNGGEIVSLVPDLRVFNKENHPLDTVTVDGETFIRMKPGDYFIYNPSSSMNALEVPIKPHEGTTPGFILYVANGENIEESSLELDYKFHRLITSEPLFLISVALFAVWLVAFVIFAITSVQIRKYNERHLRDNEIINESIETFTGFIDAKDPYTNGHSKRVAVYTKKIAQAMGYEGEDLDRIYYIALLHDCGKIGVPDNILGKPGKLTPEEFEIIKSHTVIGGEILTSFKSLEHVYEGARYHHERYDGKGYPEGKAGNDIPLIARMICVADSFDAMNTDRVYRKRLSKEQIINELEKNKGLQFDPEIADIMLKFVKNKEVPVSD